MQLSSFLKWTSILTNGCGLLSWTGCDTCELFLTQLCFSSSVWLPKYSTNVLNVRFSNVFTWTSWVISMVWRFRWVRHYKNIHIFNCLIKIIAKDSLVVAGYRDMSVLLKQNGFRHFSMIGELAQLVHKKSDKYGNNVANNVPRPRLIVSLHKTSMYHQEPLV